MEHVLADASERLHAMRDRESSTRYAVPDYLSNEWQRGLLRREDAMAEPVDGGAAVADRSSSASASSQINEQWREKICEWFYSVVDHKDFSREVVSVATSYLDRYLSKRACVSRRIFQLAAMAALYLAIKLHEGRKMPLAEFVSLGRGYFTAEHVTAMENSMLSCLEWNIHPSTALAFCSDLMLLIPETVSGAVRHDITELARFLAELSVCDYWFVTKKPSSIAIASIVNSMEIMGTLGVDVNRCHKADFFHRVVHEAGLSIVGDDEVIGCYERLREMYAAGGYSPTVTVVDADRPARLPAAVVGTAVPSRAVAAVATATVPRAVSPDTVAGSSIRSPKRRARATGARMALAKRAR